jgi:hypothetical protein
MSESLQRHIEALPWQLERTRRDRLLATCEPLGLTLEADSEEEARSLIVEALQLFLEDHRAEGTLERFLASRGLVAPGTPSLT